MNILVINHYAGSPEMGMEFRPYYFAREWTAMGHRVDIIAADFSHLRRVNPKVERDFQEEIIDGIHYHWIKTRRYNGNGAQRAITMAQFIGKLWLHTGHIIKEINPDVVIDSSTYPLDTYIGQRIRKKSKKKVKVIHEVHDMWPISPIEIGGMSPKHPFIRVMQRGEDSFCRNSDRIVSLLPNADEYLQKHGMDPEKFYHVANGVVLEEWKKPEPLPKEHRNVLKKCKQENRFIICFFGSHTKSYSLEYLIDAAKQLPKEKIAVVFIGNGIHKENLQKQAQGLKDVFHFLPPIPKQSIPSLFEYIDAPYVAAVNNNMFRFGICMNKLFDAMMGGKPILYAVNAPNNYIEEFDCGISVAAEDTEALKEGILKLLALSEEDRKRLGENGRIAVLNHFNYGVLSRKFIELLENEVKEKNYERSFIKKN